MREIKEIIIHCSDTYPDMDIGVARINQWHTERGWSSIGYHFVVKRNGVIEKGRPTEQTGAHAKGHNRQSIGVCLVGGKARDGKQATNFTSSQWASLHILVTQLTDRYKDAKVLGHNEVSSKACPTFDVAEWWYGD